MKTKIKSLILLCTVLLLQSCLNELAEVSPKNQPDFSALDGEIGLTALAKGGVYLNGFGAAYSSIDDGLGTGLPGLINGVHESLGDNVYVPWGNNDFKFLDNPTDIKLDNGTIVKMPIGTTQPVELRIRNDRAYGATNTMLIEWTYMYFMNNACNVVLDKVGTTKFSGDAASKKATITAWARFWKGYAYSRLGSMYISGIIVDKPFITSGNFVTNTALLAEAKSQFDQAKAALASITSVPDYTEVMTSLIPAYCIEKGIPSIASFTHNANTMLARNIIANKKASALVPGPMPAMTVADWNEVKTLTAAGSGMTKTDGVFAIKTVQSVPNSIIDPSFGAVSSLTAGEDNTYYVSEKFIQDIRAGDKRYDQNFDVLASPFINRRGRGLNFGSRFFLVDGGNGIPGVITYSNAATFGADVHYMAGSYEESQLMQAEALIQTGTVPAGTALIDEVRAYQGAGLGPIGAVTAAAALEEIRSERRVALFCRGLAFYDARRLGITLDKSVGGGRGAGGALNVPGYDHILGITVPGPIVLFDDGSVQKNCFINYNYLSYFDVPKNELEFNTPAAGSAVVISPN